jgi:hypothetical protein
VASCVCEHRFSVSRLIDEKPSAPRHLRFILFLSPRPGSRERKIQSRLGPSVSVSILFLCRSSRRCRAVRLAVAAFPLAAVRADVALGRLAIAASSRSSLQTVQGAPGPVTTTPPASPLRLAAPRSTARSVAKGLTTLGGAVLASWPRARIHASKGGFATDPRASALHEVSNFGSSASLFVS